MYDDPDDGIYSSNLRSHRVKSCRFYVHDSRSRSSLELATLHSTAVDFAKTATPTEMARSLKPREFPDFMQRVDKPMYASLGVLGKLYRATINSTVCHHLSWVLILSMDKHMRVENPQIKISVVKAPIDLEMVPNLWMELQMGMSSSVCYARTSCIVNISVLDYLHQLMESFSS
ncbi:Uncharacterized protein TCM_019665 [Theobroma cacao]|uniref:RNA-dependent RNA polymerase n=1 Tax=Theobroma cacao TaxID=3641 RepID=A0A061EIB9_THECC|nr:Uncharacterized protein TCM_019665 [Theobroma cacao]